MKKLTFIIASLLTFVFGSAAQAVLDPFDDQYGLIYSKPKQEKKKVWKRNNQKKRWQRKTVEKKKKVSKKKRTRRTKRAKETNTVRTEPRGASRPEVAIVPQRQTQPRSQPTRTPVPARVVSAAPVRQVAPAPRQILDVNGRPVDVFNVNDEIEFIRADLSSVPDYKKVNARRPAPSDDTVVSTYASQGDPLIWTTNGVDLSLKGRSLMNFINTVDRHGLYPEEYTQEIGSSLTNREHAMGKAYLMLARDISIGRLNPKKADTDWFITQPDADYGSLLMSAKNTGNISTLLNGMFPKNKVYWALVRELERMRHQSSYIGNWPSFPVAGSKLYVGVRNRHVALLRERLFASGHLAYNSGSELFDQELHEAVMRFQGESGMNQDGIVGKGTRKRLSKPMSRHMEQILASLERFRWLPKNLGDRYIVVNTAGYELNLIEGGNTALNMRIVVGQKRHGSKNHETPSFNRTMKYMEINPRWNVPASIASKELLPLAQKNRKYFKEHGYRVYSSSGKELDSTTVDWNKFQVGQRLPMRIVQKPSERNALGQMKFMFPNKYAIYLHDTPQKHLFSKDKRAFSHGCVRLADPVSLATKVLGKSEGEVNRLVSKGDNKTLFPKAEIPVYIVYMTAWARDNGSVVFYDDGYDRDHRMFHNFTPRV
jgi:L,D-transpeptidase YcbB